MNLLALPPSASPPLSLQGSTARLIPSPIDEGDMSLRPMAGSSRLRRASLPRSERVLHQVGSRTGPCTASTSRSLAPSTTSGAAPRPTPLSEKRLEVNAAAPASAGSRFDEKCPSSASFGVGITDQTARFPMGAVPKLCSDNQARSGKSELCEDVERQGDSEECGTWTPWRRRGWAGWMAESVVTPSLVPALVVQAFATGILDATTYADFSTFASNQTGNTILLTVSIIGTLPVLIKLTAISLGSFLVAALLMGHLGHHMGVRRRSWLLLTTLLQIVLLLVAAVLISPSGPASTQIGAEHEWLTLLLFASMSGGQVAMARQSGSQELPTAPMTSTYVDLMADKYLFVGLRHPKAGPRNRRVMYVLSMVVGGLLGAVMHRYAGSWVVVVVTAGLKVGVMGIIAVGEAEQ